MDTAAHQPAPPVIPEPGIPSAAAVPDHEVVPISWTAPPHKRNLLVEYWRKVGAGSLLMSVLIHVGLFMLAALIVIPQYLATPAVDFLPGGGGKAGKDASQELARTVTQSKRSKLNKTTPMKKVVSASTTAAIALRDVPMDSIDLPEISSLMGGAMGSGGFGKTGAGGGFGSGVGIGGQRGMTFKPIVMFGKELKDSRKIAVVMDVSRSMTKYLPAVAKELDKIASQSVLVLYFGCGLVEPKKKIDDEVIKADGDQFATFWQHWQGKTPLNLPEDQRKLLAYDASKPMPLEDIYKHMEGRMNTYFVNFNGITHTQCALLSKEVMEADTIYWFADFQDRVEDAQMDAVRRKLKYRKQKLVIHASLRGRSFDRVVSGLVEPLGGEVIEAEVKKQD